MEILDILDEISRGENIDIHVKSENKHIRKAVAEEGYKLDVLIRDPSDEVRAAVARRGYGLSELKNDRSDWVRFAVLETKDKFSRNNAGYDIINRICMGNMQLVMGYNSNAHSPFVTWEFEPNSMTYSRGHYFSSQAAATTDLFVRATGILQIDNHSFRIGLLSEHDHQKLRQKYREETAQEDISYAIESLCETYDYDYSKLLSNTEFMKKAISKYWHLDHSYENEMVLEALREIAQHMQLEKNETGQGRIDEEEINDKKEVSSYAINLNSNVLSMKEDNTEHKNNPVMNGLANSPTNRTKLSQQIESAKTRYSDQLLDDNEIPER